MVAFEYSFNAFSTSGDKVDEKRILDFNVSSAIMKSPFCCYLILIHFRIEVNAYL